MARLEVVYDTLTNFHGEQLTILAGTVVDGDLAEHLAREPGVVVKRARKFTTGGTISRFPVIIAEHGPEVVALPPKTDQAEAK